MTRKLLHITTSALLIVGFLYTNAASQYVNLRMEVEPELSASVMQELNFGEVVVNSGTRYIEAGSPGMGIFQIRGLSNQRVLITLDPPSSLTNSNPNIDQDIPLSLQYSYSNSGLNNTQQALPFSGNSAWFRMGDGSTQWHSAFVYVFGSVDIGDVPEGAYSGTIMLTVEYQ